MIHQSLLRYRSARYLWWSLGLVIACWALYLTQGRLQPAGGGTWQGYVLGTIGALLIVWLALLGIRKRRYSSTAGSVQGWASAHIYLGTGLIAVATLHCAARFGWNIHTLAYALMCVVVVSGIYGVFTYLTHPALIARNREGGIRAQLFAELFDLDRQARALAKKCDPAVMLAVDSSIERTAIGGTALAQILGQDRSWFMQSAARGGTATLTGNKDQQPAIDFVAARLPRADKSAEAANIQQLVVILCRRQAVLRRIRRDVRLQGLLKAWIYLHVPLTVALIGALIAHIVSTFLYW